MVISLIGQKASVCNIKYDGQASQGQINIKDNKQWAIKMGEEGNETPSAAASLVKVGGEGEKEEAAAL